MVGGDKAAFNIPKLLFILFEWKIRCLEDRESGG